MEKHHNSSPSIVLRGSQLSRYILSVGLGLTVLYYLLHPRHASSTSEILSSEVTDARYLHLLIPADKRDINVCKAIVSSAVLNYPVPTLINWGENFTDSGVVAGGSHLAKITGVLDYLNKLPPERDQDLILMVDGHDIWFQLRPGVLLERYFDILQRENARIKARLGKAAVDQEGISQRIIFSTQKRCWPREADDPGCYAVPDSLLPKDVYGPYTDTDIGDTENPYRKFRPRYLNSGVGMGDVAAMRKLFVHALERMNEDRNFGSDQNIFAQILGEQEFQREVIRERYLEKSQEWEIWLRRKLGWQVSSILDRHPSHRHMDHAEGSPYEFGLGLDYESLLGHTTVFAEYDSEWVTFNQLESIEKAKELHNITTDPELVTADDILRSHSPFWSLNDGKDLPSGKLWGDVSLYTNLWTAVTPSIIHHNAHIHNMKSLRESVWDKMWFQPYARTMLTNHINEPYKALAILRDKTSKVAWWPMHHEKWVTRTSKPDQEWVNWDELCLGFEEELFRDGKGAWQPPRSDY